MLRVFSILFMNGWYGLSRKSGLRAALMLTFAAAIMLAVGGTADATVSEKADPAVPAHHSTMAALQDDQNRQIAQVLQNTKNSSLMASGMTGTGGVHTSVGGQIATNDDGTGRVPSLGESNSGLTSATDQSPPITLVGIQLAPWQATCRQGQTVYQIASAQLQFQNPLVNDTTITWRWEVENESGQAVSQSQPVLPNGSQTIPAGTATVTLTSPDATQPLLHIPASENSVYNLRLHITGSIDTASDWISTPQVGSTCSQTSSMQPQVQSTEP